MSMNHPEVDYLIIGAGPAGLQLGYFLEKAGRSYLILESADKAGAFFEKFPRHRQLISINKVQTGYTDPETNLRWDWNSLLSDDEDLVFKRYTREYFPAAEDLVRYLGDFAVSAGLRIRYGARVVNVAKNGSFKVAVEAGEIFCGRRLIVATGLSKPFVPPIPGIELTESYCDVSVDPDDFLGQRVLIIGKGNSGFETADNLVGTTALTHVVSPNNLNLAWKSHFVGHLRAVNNNFLDTYQLKSQNAVLDGTLRKIERTADGRYRVDIAYTHAEEESEGLIYDRIITCAGFRFDDSIFDASCRPELCLDDRFPKQTSAWRSTNVEGLYFAGTLTQMRDFKKTTSGFIHGFRYNTRALHRIFECIDHGGEWPSERIDAGPRGLCEALLQRINRSSALWQQFGFLGDLISISDDGSEARYYEEMPVDWIHDSELGRHADYFILTLEFGEVVGDPFNIQRQPDPDKAERSTFLHPVIRHYRGRDKVSELHLLENLFGEWWDPELHVGPLSRYLVGERLGARAAEVA